MKLTVFAILFIILFSPLFSQEQPGMSPEQKAWMEYAQPGEMHQRLAEREGKWKVYTEMWMQPDSEPMKSEGTAEYKMILGGRYLYSWHTGTSMGMPFEGMSIEAYDNAEKEFITTWIDSFGTGITVSKGKYDEASKTLTAVGTMVDPVTGGELKYKTVVNEVNKDKGIFNMYMINPDGSEYLSMRMTYVRDK